MDFLQKTLAVFVLLLSFGKISHAQTADIQYFIDNYTYDDLQESLPKFNSSKKLSHAYLALAFMAESDSARERNVKQAIVLSNNWGGQDRFQILLNSSVTFKQGKQYSEAVYFAKQAYNLAFEQEKKNLMAEALHELGLIYNSKGIYSGSQNDHKQAVEYYLQALALDYANPTYAISTLINIGYQYTNLDQPEKTIIYLKQALDRLPEVKNVENRQDLELEILDDMQFAHRKLGEYNKQEEKLNKILTLSRKYKGEQPESEGYYFAYEIDALNDLGLMNFYQEKFDQAFGFHRKALELAESVQDYYEVALAYSYMADLNEKKENYTESIGMHQLALDLFELEDEQANVLLELYSLAKVYQLTQDYPKAEQYYRASIQLAREGFCDCVDSMDIHKGFMETYLAQGKITQAQSYYLAVLNSFDKPEQKKAKGGFMASSAKLLLLNGQLDRAKEIADEAYDLLFELSENTKKETNKKEINLIISSLRSDLLIIQDKKQLTLEKSVLETEKNLALEKAASEKVIAEKQKALAEKKQLALDLSLKEKLSQKLENEKLLALLAEKNALAEVKTKELARRQAEEGKVKAQNEAKEAELLARDSQLAQREAESKEKLLKARAQRNYIIFGTASLSFLLIAFTLYRSRQKQKKVNRLLAVQNELIERERQKSENLLLNILPLKVAHELKEEGKVTIRQYEQVSVLFTDFKGFTQIAERMAPEKLIEELNDCFSNFDEIVSRYDLEKIKTIGDAYMCAGGIPEPHQSNPVKTILAALAMQQFVQERKKEKESKGKSTGIAV